MRPDINVYFLRLAELVATRSTWDGTHVGCVVVQDKQVVSTGYNGTPRGYKNNLSREERAVFCHAEENAIVQAARHGSRLDGAAFYVTLSPCLTCARMLVNVGASAVLYAKRWDNPEAEQVEYLLRACGVDIWEVDMVDYAEPEEICEQG